ncbi:hypothetical protein [Chryseobacterium gambrini]|uniref:hypothetical protein n=1 Tax=Chryseobacterium gambrini TaxID=373672 RepID=UPI0022F3D996|nr:hypothetical protein [Chryseobacterium gambrini]WBX96365.1 hypothetical protein PE065_16130 [Chryseobacterium gambrini]
MITKKIIGICLLAGLFTISCSKNETKNKAIKADSMSVSQPVEKTAVPVEKKDSSQSDEQTESPEEKDTKKTVSKTSVEGKFIATTCEGARFSIEFKNTDGNPTFKILDKTKVIAAGNVSAETDEKTGAITNIMMGEIGGVYEGDKIVIQNYGNAMNEFEHFTQCGDKYLEFTRQK